MPDRWEPRLASHAAGESEFKFARPWQAGDRIEVRLPDRNGLRGRAGSHNWFPGTVRDIDTGSRPGVRVDLDFKVNGASDCYATHAELRREGEGDAGNPA